MATLRQSAISKECAFVLADVVNVDYCPRRFLKSQLAKTCARSPRRDLTLGFSFGVEKLKPEDQPDAVCAEDGPFLQE